MMSTTGGRLGFLTACALLSGCAQLQRVTDEDHRKEALEQIAGVDQHSTFPAVRRKEFEQVNLVEMIDPHGQARHQYPALWGAAVKDGHPQWGRRYDLVLSWFRESSLEPESKRIHRNSVQDKILAVATSRCNVFKTYLRRQQTETNFLLGVSTTVAGVLGAVLQGATASRNLAGAAGLLSGAQAEFNQTYYSNLAAHVIVQGIELRQNKLVSELTEKRRGLGVEQYSMEAAIKDALLIDGSCSAVSGLIEAQESIKQIENPGIHFATRAMVSAMAMKEIASGKVSSLARDGSLDKLLALAAPGVPSLMVSTLKTSPESTGVAALASARDARQRLAAGISAQADALRLDFKAMNDEASDTERSKLSADTVADTYAGKAGAELQAALENGKPLPICINALESPAAGFAQASAKLLLASASDPGDAAGGSARITAQAAADAEGAKLHAATRRVNLVAAAYSAAIAESARPWRAMFAKNKPLDATRIKNEAVRFVVDEQQLRAVCAGP